MSLQTLKYEVRNSRQELTQPIVEEFIPGHQRRFSLHPSGRVEVDNETNLR